MKCPKCNKEGFRYDVSWYRKKDGMRKDVTPEVRQKGFIRTNFKAKCKECGYKNV